MRHTHGAHQLTQTVLQTRPTTTSTQNTTANATDAFEKKAKRSQYGIPAGNPLSMLLFVGPRVVVIVVGWVRQTRSSDPPGPGRRV